MLLLIPPIRLPLAVVDAGVHQYLIAERFDPNLTVRRQMLTLGSVRYTFAIAGDDIATVTLRSMGHDLTFIGWKPVEAVHLLPNELQHKIEDLIRNYLWDIKNQTEQDVQAVTAGINDLDQYTTQIVNLLTASEEVARQLRKPGRPTEEEDMWAWEEINLRHRPKEQVRPIWEAKVDANKDRIVEKKSRTRIFNRIIQPNWSPAKKKHG